MVDLTSFVRLFLKLRAIAIENEVDLKSFLWFSNLLFKHQTGPLLVVHDLVLELVNFVITLIDLLCHLLDAASSFFFVPFQVLNVLQCLFQFCIFRFD